MSLITPGFGLIFWMVIIFGAVLLILSKAGFPVISQMLQKRSDHIEESLRKAEQAQAVLEGLAEQQAQLIAQTKEQQAQIVKETAQLRDKIVAQARLDAEQQASDIVARAREQIATERENTLREISHLVSILSVQVAEKILREQLSDDAQQSALIDRYIDELTDSNKPSLRA